MNKDELLVPVQDGWFAKSYNATTHRGIDIGWVNNANANIFACDDGKVVDIGYHKAELGYFVTLQHDYEDGTHRWTSYIHLKRLPALKIGDSVKQGQNIGQRGSTGASSGPHLHLYVTKCTTDGFKKEWLTKNFANTKYLGGYTIDPLPLLRKQKDVKYVGSLFNNYITKYLDDEKLKSLQEIHDEIKKQLENLQNEIMKLNQK